MILQAPYLGLNEMIGHCGHDLPPQLGSFSEEGIPEAFSVPLVKPGQQLWGSIIHTSSTFIVWILQQHSANWGNRFPRQNLCLNWFNLDKTLNKYIVIDDAFVNAFVNAFVGGAAEWFTSTQPTSIGMLLWDTPVIRRGRLSVQRFWHYRAVNNMKKYKCCYFMLGLRIKVQQLIGMDIFLKIMMQSMNLWSLRLFTCAPDYCTIHKVILGFQCFIVGRLNLLLLAKRPRWLFRRLEDYWAARTRRRVDSLKVIAACFHAVKKGGGARLSPGAPSPIISDQSRISLKARKEHWEHY